MEEREDNNKDKDEEEGGEVDAEAVRCSLVWHHRVT